MQMKSMFSPDFGDPAQIDLPVAVAGRARFVRDNGRSALRAQLKRAQGGNDQQ